MANWSESEADYKTRCPYCGSYLVASLTIIKKQVRTLPIQSADWPSQAYYNKRVNVYFT